MRIVTEKFIQFNGYVAPRLSDLPHKKRVGSSPAIPTITQNKMYNVKIVGFDTQKAAQTFIDWFIGQGEQDQAIWFECQDVQHQYVDCYRKPYKDEQDNLTIHLRPTTE